MLITINGESGLAERSSTPLLATKLKPPPRRVSLVARPRLERALNHGADALLTLVVAPAGFGKTTLVREWCEKTDRRVGWVSLDAGDNDPIRFLTYLITALRSVCPGIGDAALSLLRSPQPPPLVSVMTLLLNEMGGLTADCVLVLDDYHLIDDAAVHEAVAFLLEHMPPALRLLIATRSDPPLPLSRLRVRGQLCELRAEGLRCLPEEAAEFLNGIMGLELSMEAVKTLESRTEGWLAGLQLAALSLQRRTDADAFIREFAGSHRYIVDYLGDEVFGRLPADMQLFLLRTSVLDRLYAPLCDAVADRSDSQWMLERLDDANLFLVALDEERCWYRYHHLFGDMLRVRLQQERPLELPELHRRACGWYEAQGIRDAAIPHALAGRHYDEAARLIVGAGDDVWKRGETDTLQRWIDALPAEQVQSDYRLNLFQARMLLISADVDRIAPIIENARKQAEAKDALEGPVRGELLALDAFMARFEDDNERATALMQEALQLLPADSIWRAVVALLLGGILAEQLDLDGSDRVMADAERIGESAGDLQVVVIARTMRALLREERGHLRSAVTLYESAMHYAAEQGADRLPVTGFAMVGLANIRAEQGELGVAELLVREGLERGRQVESVDIFQRGQRVLARIKLAQGDFDAARTSIDALEDYSRQRRFSILREAVTIWRAFVNVMSGDMESAEEWAREIERRDRQVPPKAVTYLARKRSRFMRQREASVRARVLIARQRGTEGCALLETMRTEAENAGQGSAYVEFSLLEAVAHYQNAEPECAVAALRRALRIAEPEGMYLSFSEAGPGLVPVLRLAAAQGVSSGFLSRLLNGHPGAVVERRPTGAPRQASDEVLSERELEVLRLLAAGQSNQEIADTLFISVGTVKRHVHNIYGKLDAGNRLEAVTRARERGAL